jgi:hypothetical protein
MDLGNVSKDKLLQLAKSSGISRDVLESALRKHGLSLDQPSYSTDGKGRFISVR